MSSDAHILKGMDAIINFDNVKPGIDLKELENKFINGGIVSQKVKDPQDRLNDELRIAAQKLGINFDDVGVKKQARNDAGTVRNDTSTRVTTVKLSPQVVKAQWKDDYDVNNDADNDVDTDADNDHDADDNNNDNYNNGNNDNDDDNYNSVNNDGNQSLHTQHSPFARVGSTVSNSNGSLLSHTLEQERRSHIDSILRPDNKLSFSLEKEKREDMKCAMLAEIDSLLSSLKMEDVDLGRIPNVDMKSSYEEIETILKILRHKNDQTRCQSFAEEVMMFAAYGLEDVFDGKRTYFGRWNPDLTGWHNHLNVKLKRCRYDTGQVVGAFMEDYNIGPGARIAIEVIPNMFLYSKMRKQQYNSPSLSVSDNEVEQASQRIRDM